MYEASATLAGRRQVGGGMWALTFGAPQIAAAARAGQFVNLGLVSGPLLRRPFSVFRADGDRIEVVLRPVGVGTRMLLALRPGDAISCLGPLGRPFEIDPEQGSVVLLSGGLGVAPMIMAAREALQAGLRVTWVHGARSSTELCREWEGHEVIWATEDGSQGRRGTALDAVPEAAAQVLACGPNPMLAAVARRWGEAQVSLETYMGCGTGVCLGCAVPLAEGGYDRACTEGPIYRASAVAWNRLPSHLAYGPPK